MVDMTFSCTSLGLTKIFHGTFHLSVQFMRCCIFFWVKAVLISQFKWGRSKRYTAACIGKLIAICTLRGANGVAFAINWGIQLASRCLLYLLITPCAHHSTVTITLPHWSSAIASISQHCKAANLQASASTFLVLHSLVHNFSALCYFSLATFQWFYHCISRYCGKPTLHWIFKQRLLVF